jgi:cytochrome c peroxidase
MQTSNHHLNPRRPIAVWLRWAAAVIAVAVAGTGPLRAVDVNVHVREIMAGANGSSRVQFLVIAQESAGQNLWGPQPGEAEARARLQFFDAVGRHTGTFAFPANPGTGGSLLTLVATAEFAALPGVPAPDLIMPALLEPHSGMVCLESSSRRECVAYGAFQGDTGINLLSTGAMAAGPPAPGLSITGLASIRRLANTGRNEDFLRNLSPAPTNLAGGTASWQAQSLVEQGARLFAEETFVGTGRTCATCHAPADSFGLRPASVQSRFATVAATYDPLFVAEVAPSAFDAGFDFNVNVLVLTAPVSTLAPCTGQLRGTLSDGQGGQARVVSRLSATEYLIGGGLSPRLVGTVSDGACVGTVADVVAGDLGAVPGASIAGLEDPRLMRTSRDRDFPQGRALFLENVDGLTRPPVFRKSPHLLNLRFTAPYGFSGDVPDLQTFSTAAVTQHFPRTLARSHTGIAPDFRLPESDELAALEAFMLALEFPAGGDPDKFNLDRFTRTPEQRRGRNAFFGNQAKCSRCHGGPVLAATTVPIPGIPVGTNGAFDTGVTQQAINGPDVDNLPCEPATPALGACGSRAFSVPQLFNVANLTPLFHDGSAATVRDAVDFYDSPAFNNSPAGRAIGGINMNRAMRRDITAFLEALVEADTAPMVTRQPASQAVMTGATAVFTAEAVGTPDPAIQWQSSSDQGASWLPLSDVPPHQGVTSSTLVVSSVTGSLDGRLYRAVFSNRAGETASAAAQLSVTGALVVTPATLSFTAVKPLSGASVLAATTPQVLDVRFAGQTSTWTAVADQAWIALSRAAGTGPGSVTVGIANPGNVIGQAILLTGTVTITPDRAGLSPVTVAVALAVEQTTTPSAPFGQVDTPAQEATGVVGAIAVTGWALDDVGVDHVRIYRDCQPSDPPAACQSWNGYSMVYVANAPLIDDARPDVAAAFPLFANAARAGWGALVLTNVLPDVTAGTSSGGHGRLALYAIATDVDGHQTLLGRSQVEHAPTFITMANRFIDRPFGTIDTPRPSDVVSGTIASFGWALTPDGNALADAGDIDIASDGSTVTLFIDGQPQSTVAFGQCRGTVQNPVTAGIYCDDDVASVFGWAAPQPAFSTRTANPTRYRNLDAGRGAIGAVAIDTATLLDGLHSIAWSVTDSAGRTSGIGSRLFEVRNGASASAGTARRASRMTGVSLPVDSTLPMLGRTGFDLSLPLQPLTPNADGVPAVTMAPLSRLEIHAPDGVEGYLVVDGLARPLPSGSQLDAAAGVFTWAPGPGYLGTYELAFVADDGRGSRVVVTLAPPPDAGPALRWNLDAPRHGGQQRGSLHVAGWGLDTGAFTGAGVAAVHVWARRVDTAGASATFVGSAQLNVRRPDVEALYGSRFHRAGFELTADLPPGEYEISSYVWVTRTGRWEDARTVRVSIR